MLPKNNNNESDGSWGTFTVAQLPRSMRLMLVPAEKSAPHRLQHALRSAHSYICCVNCYCCGRSAHVCCVTTARNSHSHIASNASVISIDKLKKPHNSRRRQSHVNKINLFCRFHDFIASAPDFHSPLHLTHSARLRVLYLRMKHRVHWRSLSVILTSFLHSKMRKANETIKRPTDFHIITL